MSFRGTGLRRIVATLSTLTAALVAVTSLAASAPPASVQAAATLPSTVPSVQEVTPGTGAGYGWASGARIVVNAGQDTRLAADARTFAADLAGLLGDPAPAVVSGTPGSARPGDISLSLGNTDSRLGTEGYGMTIRPICMPPRGRSIRRSSSRQPRSTTRCSTGSTLWRRHTASRCGSGTTTSCRPPP